MNLTLTEYQQASDKQKLELIRCIEQMRPDLHFESFLSPYYYQLPRFSFAPIEMNFIYIPGGTFTMGLSKSEEQAARKICDPLPVPLSEMRPVREVQVDSFLVSETPFLHRHALTMLVHHNAYVDTYLPDYHFICEFEDARALAAALQTDLPREYQWEYFCRANTNTLFCFGNTLPDKQELSKWFQTHDCDLSTVKRNNFGLSCLFWSEWCNDFFHLNQVRNAKGNSRIRLIRGGAADCWPWTSNEWVGCVSAKRTPATWLIEDAASFRLVINLTTKH
jgi:formylglycine-generating enzyme required for sulfatase activity